MNVINRLLAAATVAVVLSAHLAPTVKASAASGTLNYTALGDSLAVGIADFSGGGYVPRYAANTRADTASTVVLQNPLDSNLAAPGRRNGWTSGQLLNALRTDENLRNLIAGSQVVTWDVGGNDFLRALNTYSTGTCGGLDGQDCLRDAVSTLKVNWSAITAEILSLRSTSNTVIRTMDIYNPFVNTEKATGTFTIIKAYLDDANRYIAMTAAANNIPCARVYEAFNGPNGDQDAAAKGYISPLDPSGVHPGDLGHNVIAELLRNLGYAPLLGPPTESTVGFGAANYGVGEGGGRVTVTVTRSGEVSAAASVDYRTADTDTYTFNCADTVNNRGGAFARCDYATVVGTLIFAAGETAKTITVPIIDDAHVEGGETFQLVLSNPTGGTLGTPSTTTVMITDNDTAGTANPNPITTTPFFVRQQYIDFLSREPEAGEPWTGVLNRCRDVNNPFDVPLDCDRINVSLSFFGSPEFRLKGFYVFLFYKVGLNRLPLYTEIVPDMSAVTGTTPADTFARRTQLANGFVQRAEFTNLFPASMTNQVFVTTLLGRYQLTSVTTPDPQQPEGTVKVTLTNAQLVAQLTANTLTRAQVLRAIVQSDEVNAREFDNTFVAMQYYGYLRRTPDQGGYDNNVGALKSPRLINSPTRFREIVNAFVNSVEYRLRFGDPNR